MEVDYSILKRRYGLVKTGQTSKEEIWMGNNYVLYIPIKKEDNVSRKHNTKHNRSASNYPERLSARGLSKAPQMKSLSTLCRDKNCTNYPHSKDN